jgi:hypothetical protein
LARLARHAHHYLAIFEKGKALAMYQTKRLASPGRRIVLYANDRAGYALLGIFHGQQVRILPGAPV